MSIPSSVSFVNTYISFVLLLVPVCSAPDKSSYGVTPNTSHIINILSLTGFVRFFFQSLIELSAIPVLWANSFSDSYLFLLIIQISYRLSSSFYFSFIYIYSQRPFPCILSYFSQFVYTYLLFYKNFIVSGTSCSPPD